MGLPSVTQIAAARARHPDPAPTGSDLIAMLDAQMRDGGSIDIGNWVISFDEDWEEPSWQGDHSTGRGEDVLVATPSFVLTRDLNGTRTREAFPSLISALREVESWK